MHRTEKTLIRHTTAGYQGFDNYRGTLKRRLFGRFSIPVHGRLGVGKETDRNWTVRLGRCHVRKGIVSDRDTSSFSGHDADREAQNGVFRWTFQRLKADTDTHGKGESAFLFPQTSHPVQLSQPSDLSTLAAQHLPAALFCRSCPPALTTRGIWYAQLPFCRARALNVIALKPSKTCAPSQSRY